jgi:hypothetical protein
MVSVGITKIFEEESALVLLRPPRISHEDTGD